MSNNDIISAPLGICEECLQDVLKLEKPEDAALGGLYCQHNKSGALLNAMPDGRAVWSITVPVSRDQFGRLVERAQERQRDMFAATSETIN